MQFNKFIFTALVSVFSALQCTANLDLHEMTEDLFKTFPLSEKSKVEVENHYGDVVIEHWPIDSVAFEIEIIAYSEKEEHLEDLLGMVEVDFDNYGSFIIVETLIGEEKNIFNKAAFSFSKNIAGTREVRVNYIIKLPNTTTISVENEFGDVFIDDYKGSFSLELSHGDFRANSLQNIKSIKSRHGEVKIDYAKGGRLDLGFVSGAELGEVEDVFIKSSSSEIEIENMDVLKLESRLDEIYVENLGRISGKTTMTKVHIKHLKESAELESKYGNIRLENIAGSASRVKLNGANTDYEMNFNEDLSGTFEIQMTSKNDFQTAGDKVKLKDQIALDDKTNIYSGSLNDSTGTVRLILTTKNGDISLGM